MRARLSLAIVPCVAVLAACGGQARPAPPPVRLTIATPSDGTTTLSDSVQVSGDAPGAATVLVAGRSVSVSGGSFSAQIAIKPGANVIDVLAGAPRTQDAMSAVRVYRQLPVAVPNVLGKSASAAVAALTRVGLTAQLEDTSGFFQSLLPISKQVCATHPSADSRLAPGSRVTVQIAKIC